MSGLYIHIPFCKSKCAYCAFPSYAGRADLIRPYLAALAKEAAFYKKKFSPRTLYVGGGTPSILSAAQINQLCGVIEKNFGPLKNFKETAFECNPESITEEKLKILKKRGFTRLSIGMQAAEDKYLKLIGRAHDAERFAAAFALAAKYFDNINIDIIAALPRQNLAAFKRGLAYAAGLGAAHISVYGLSVEEGTPLFKSGFAADDDLCRAMLEHAAKYLPARGCAQYEISNFARRGRESLHNINYWRGGQYLGLGAAAASYIKGARRCNTADLRIYINALQAGRRPPREGERLRGKAKLGEQIILGLRMTDGVKITAPMQKAFGADFAKLAARGLLEISGKNIRLSEEGKYLANEVWRHFVEPF
ncbi:MAG: radical SAM family heme chaperone HemW [Elusimicrobiota bacterium]|nr:radical SAM family heme chaperone HemW [Elusimicrobiota bacterium]